MNQLQVTTIQQQCRALHLGTIGAQCAPLAEAAIREKQGHLDYLETLLNAEIEESRSALRAPQGYAPAPVTPNLQI